MKEFIDKLIERLEEEKQSNPCRNTQCKECKYTNECYEGEMCYKVGVDNIISIGNELAEEYKGGWIPCKRELPKDDEKVLVIDENGIMAVCRFVESVNLFMVCWDSDEFLDAIAWQPLPAPYTEGE